MAGFGLGPLNAILAGVGMGIDNIQQQRQREQDAALRQMEAQNRLLQLQNYLQDRQDTDQAAIGKWRTALGGGGLPTGTGGAGLGMPPIGVDKTTGLPGSQFMTPRLPSQINDYGATNEYGMGGPAIPTSAQLGGDPRGMAPIIVNAARQAGVDPSTALRVSQTEGLNAPFAGGDGGKSFGAMQLYTGGGMGNQFQQQTGMNPADPRTENAATEWAISQVPSTGWTPFHGAARAGIGPRQGIGSEDPAGSAGKQYAQAGPQTMTDAGGGDDVAARLGPRPKPLTEREVAQAIDAANPGVSEKAKAKIFEKQWPEMRQQRRDEIAEWNSQFAIAKEGRSEALAGQGSPEALMVKQPDGSMKPEMVTYDKLRKVYTNQQGKRVEVAPIPKATQEEKFGDINDLMRRWHQDFVGKEGRQPTTDEIATKRAEFSQEIKPPGQIAQNVAERIMIGGNEVAKSVAALTKLGPGATLGIFGGAQTALNSEMIGNIKRNFANKLVGQREQMVASFGRGIGRGLAQLAGAGSAQGLQNLATQLEKDMPQDNDTWGNILAKYGSIRDTADGALEVLVNDPRLTQAQKAQIGKIMDNIKTAIPFTRADVAAIAVDDSDESIAEFARKMGVVKGDVGGGGAGAAPKGGLSDKSDEELWKAIGVAPPQ